METLADSSQPRRSKVVDYRPGSSQQMIMMKPANLSAAKEICNHLRAGRSVVCNFERIDQPVAQRVIDFISGAAHAVDGQVRPISNLIFMVLPRQVYFLDGQEVQDERFDPIERRVNGH